jgi:glycolate oxidase
MDAAALLREVLPAGLVLDDPDVLASYAADQSQLTTSAVPAAVVVPRSTADVVAVVKAAAACGLPVVARGAGSGLSGGANAAAGAVVVSLHRLDRVLRLDPVDRVAVVQPGVVTGDLRAAAAQAGLFYPPDPGSLSWCTVGGNVATDAGGMCCVKYGVTGDFVLALEVVLADGRVLRTGTATVKGVAGYDLTSLFVGSEGTLGIVTEITVRLLPAPPPPVTLVASFASTAEAGAVRAADAR